MKIILIPEVLRYLEDLTHRLYFNHYFGSEEAAREYVDEIIDDIAENLPTLTRKDATPYFDRFGEGMYYVTLRKNRHTHWYVFFDVYTDDNEQTIHVVRYIGNNHNLAQHL
jgi:hypothetical protein